MIHYGTMIQCVASLLSKFVELRELLSIDTLEVIQSLQKKRERMDVKHNQAHGLVA